MSTILTSQSHVSNLMQLRHVHLVSSNPYPKIPQVNLDIAVEYLLQAPRIVREVAPMSWMYLDCPPDGENMLVWQPSQLIAQPASDGFIWADGEMAYSSELRGYVCFGKSMA